jgi:tRNA dimethylallyltransferase
MHSTVIIVESMSATSSVLVRVRLDCTTTSVCANAPSSARRAASGAIPKIRSAASPSSIQPLAPGAQPASRSRSIAVEISPAVSVPEAISVAVNIEHLPKVALIAGPTASGKSALALAIAAAHNGVVINADSAQVYADLRILTARPSAEEEASAPHRLFGHVDAADATYSAARWAAEATRAIDATLAEGRLPILVGGTGLYVRTLLDGIAPVPAIDPALREQIRALPVAEAHAALAQLDPPAAARLNAADTTRVARALEVVRGTGRTLADWQTERVGGIGDRLDVRALILIPDRDWLNARIDQRFAEMAETSQAEVTALLARTDIPQDAPIRRAIGVPEIAALVRGETSLTDAIAAGSLATRRYAKRQYTWLRHQPPAAWTRTDARDFPTRLQQFETILLK